MLPYLVTLDAVYVNNWTVKASSFDDQILILFFNNITMACIVRIFLDEEEAHIFFERVIKNDPSIENYYR